MALAPAYSSEQQLRLITESLTTRERLYGDARLNGTPAVASARVAGFSSPQDASQRLENDERLRTYMQMALKYQVTQANITRDDVINGILEAVNYATTATEIIKAWSEVGKIIGAYAPKKVEHSQTQDPQRLQRMSDAELLEQAGDVVDGDYEPIDFDEGEEVHGPDQHG